MTNQKEIELKDIIDCHCDDIPRYGGATLQWRSDLLNTIIAWNKHHDTRRELDDAEIIRIALENGFMITTQCGQEEPKIMPSSDKDTLVKFARACQTFKPVVDEEKLEMIILDVQEEFERGFSKDETCIKLLQSHRRAIAKAIASHANEGRGVANN